MLTSSDDRSPFGSNADSGEASRIEMLRRDFLEKSPQRHLDVAKIQAFLHTDFVQLPALSQASL